MGRVELALGPARRIVLALTLGLASLITTGVLALIDTSRAVSQGSQLVVRDATHTWMVTGASTWGLRWRLAESTRDLAVPTVDIGDAPTQYDDLRASGWRFLSRESPRTGLLELGWPVPWMAWRFHTQDQGAIFPPAIEASDEVTVLEEASRRGRDGEGVRVFRPRTTLWGGLVFLGFTCAWFAILQRLNWPAGPGAPRTRTGTSAAPGSPSPRLT